MVTSFRPASPALRTLFLQKITASCNTDCWHIGLAAAPECDSDKVSTLLVWSRAAPAGVSGERWPLEGISRMWGEERAAGQRAAHCGETRICPENKLLSAIWPPGACVHCMRLTSPPLCQSRVSRHKTCQTVANVHHRLDRLGFCQKPPPAA